MSAALGESANIAELFRRMAAQRAGQVAIKIPRGRRPGGAIDYAALSFAELAAEAGAWQARLQAAGVRRGDRTLVMVRPGLPLVAATFALFAQGAVPVVIDPGMGWKSFFRCVAQSRPRVLLGIPLAQVLSRIFRSAFRGVECRVRASGSLTARLTPAATPAHLEPVASASEELAAILFTSGSTGAPKGVRYEHGTLAAQVRLVRAAYDLEPGEIDLPLLPVFALFNPALGLTTIVPEIDPRRPAQVDPAKIVQAIQQEGVTNSFGSPTLWRKIADHCLARGITLPSLRRVLCAGAPVPESLWRDAPRFLPAGELHSPYGATEALPVSSIRGEDVRRLQGVESPDRESLPPRGACVGRPLPGVEVRILEMTEGPLATLTAARELPPGEIGEIVVHGPMVSRAYDGLPEATARAKIPVSGEALPWHRMGDCGYRDAEGRLWFCGRQVERVQTAQGPLFTEPCEQVFRRHAAVARCALVGLGPPGDQEPALVVQLRAPASETERCQLAREFGDMARRHEVTAGIRRCFFHPEFPVDVRHNAKIHRLTLARWAEKTRAYPFSGGER